MARYCQGYTTPICEDFFISGMPFVEVQERLTVMYQSKPHWDCGHIKYLTSMPPRPPQL